MSRESKSLIINDSRFKRALELFNSEDWYLAHDAFEELWHETIGPERNTIQGILQIAVAQVHIDNANFNGATILYGEGLGRLRRQGIPDLGIDIVDLCKCIDTRLKLLQKRVNPSSSIAPYLKIKSKTLDSS